MRGPRPRRERETSVSATPAPDDRADTAGGLEDADTRVAEAEQIDGRRDDEDAERTGDEALGVVEADQEPQPWLVRDRAETVEQRAQSAGLVVVLLGRGGARPQRRSDEIRTTKSALHANVAAITANAAV